MNKLRNRFLITLSVCLTALCLLLIAPSAQAQTKAATDDGRGASSRKTSRADSRLADLPASAGPARRRGFSLMPQGSAAGASASRFHTTTAAAPAVHGNGTVGKVPLWADTGASGDSMLGDSIITQAMGLIGIGVATPTSKLTVQGMIETTLGGYKFPDGTVQTTAAMSGLQAVSHDATLQGAGSGGAPLGVAVPLTLTGTGAGSVLNVRNTDGYTAVIVDGSVRVRGGDFPQPGFAGLGMDAAGGNAPNGGGGDGVRAIGGDGIDGGEGVRAIGGNSSGAIGGNGVQARGGDSSYFGGGGHGVFATGGAGVGAGKHGGIGIIAIGGLGRDSAQPGDAGNFVGDVDVTGNLSKGGGSFKIDHPLDPENKYLYHSFVESPDMMNIYNGNVTTDQNGEATVELPAYFEALNKDFRYQLTVIGTFAQAIVADEITDNRFHIKTSAPRVKVSWQVTGIRHDAYADRRRIKVEEDKPESERGYFLHPEAFRQSEERGVEWARHPEMMRRMKEAREQARQKAAATRQ